MTRLFIIAGEASGDTHGAGLLAALRDRGHAAEVRGLGGPKLRALAGEGVDDWTAEAGVVGLWEVVRRYGWFRKVFDAQLERIRAWDPDAVILVDYPGFNLRLARALDRAGHRARIIYFISPQVWAWNRGRIPKMARWIDLMLCLFPFEAALYNASGLKTVFVGHPMIDQLAREKIAAARDPDLVGLFPGSREREVARHFPMLIESARMMRSRRAGLRFAVAAATEEQAGVIREMARDCPWCEVTSGNAHELMQRAGVGVVASGTATLEAAYFGLPYCLVYKVSWPTYIVGRALVRVPFLGIVNILGGREIVREFIQADARPATIASECLRLLDDHSARKTLEADLSSVIAGLGSGGACARAAEAVVAELDRDRRPIADPGP